MATIRIENDTLFVDLSGWEVFWAFHGSFAIPLADVAGASTAKPPGFFETLKLIGTNAPRMKMAGTSLFHGEVVFVDYRGNEESVLAIDVRKGNYKHLFVHVDNPQDDAAKINAALRTSAA